MPTLLRTRQYVLTFLAASLASTILLKVGEIQFLELIFLIDLLILLSQFIFQNRMHAAVFRPFFKIAVGYGIFMAAAFFLSLYALRQNFFPYGAASVLKFPLVLTIARITELLLDVFYMLYLASLYRKDEKLCAFGMRTYYWVGIASAVYTLVSYPLNRLYGLDLGTYGDLHRMRGFYNEGGPFGVYIVSLLLVSWALRRKHWLTRSQFVLGTALLLVCLEGSQSKSALVLIFVLGLIDVFLLLKRRGRKIIIAVPCLVLIIGVCFVDFQRGLELIEEANASYRWLSTVRPDDGNIVLGRVAGAVLAPRMIATHPLAGVGWGNYALVRNDPQYRQGTAFSWTYDAPGLGPIDYIVDLGIPLWLYLLWIEFRPFRLLRRRKVGLLLLNLGLMQPLANIFGAHLNLTYPWVVMSFALGLGFAVQRQECFVPEAAVVKDIYAD
jgi:hypothetical protein